MLDDVKGPLEVTLPAALEQSRRSLGLAHVKFFS